MKFSLTKGQVLYYVPFEPRRNPPFEATVVKVGRKWAELDRGRRIDLTSGTVEYPGWGGHDRVFESQDAYDRHAEADLLWGQLYRKLYGAVRPSGTDSDRIRKAAELLGITLDEG